MEDYPSNRQTERRPPLESSPVVKKEGEPKKKVERVVKSGEVIRRKKPLGRRFKETFLGGDGKGALNYVMLEVIVPYAKDMVADAVQEGIERRLWGEVRSARRRSVYRPGGGVVSGYVNYGDRFTSAAQSASNVYRGQDPRGASPALSNRAKATHDFGEIIIPTRSEAEEVLDRLADLVGRYEVATVRDLYEMLNVPATYVDEKWGWSNLAGSDIRRDRMGFLLVLPRPEPVD